MFGELGQWAIVRRCALGTLVVKATNAWTLDAGFFCCAVSRDQIFLICRAWIEAPQQPGDLKQLRCRFFVPQVSVVQCDVSAV